MICDLCGKDEPVLMAEPIDDYELFERGWLYFYDETFELCVECAGEIAAKFVRLKTGRPSE